MSSNQITDLPQFDTDMHRSGMSISAIIRLKACRSGRVLAVNFINADYNRVKSVAKLESCIMLVG